MFDQILQLVKEHLGNNPEIANAIPKDQQDAIHQEIATHINNGLQNTNSQQSGIGGVLSQLESNLGSGGLATNAITGGLVSSLASKFGLPPSVTGAIAAALPGLIQKFSHQQTQV
jgi:uncharacterized protein YidB (DUF937 family)